jgi:hypothetical protein
MLLLLCAAWDRSRVRDLGGERSQGRDDIVSGREARGRRVVPRGTSILGRAPAPWWGRGISKRPSMMDSLRALASSARRRSEERPLNAPEESPRRPLSASLPSVAGRTSVWNADLVAAEKTLGAVQSPISDIMPPVFDRFAARWGVSRVLPSAQRLR